MRSTGRNPVGCGSPNCGACATCRVVEYDEVLDKITALAPAGDGGLREALEKLVEAHGGPDGYVMTHVLKKALAAYPAAPAVARPVDREALRMALEQALGLSKGVLATTHQNHGFDSGCPVCRGKSAEIAEAVVDDVLAVLAGEQEQTT